MHLYCDLNFLAYLFKYPPKPSFSLDEKEALRDDFFQCMQQKTTTTAVNIHQDAINFEQTPFLRQMLNSAQQGKGKVKFDTTCLDKINEISFYENLPASKIISTTKTDAECTKLTEKYATPFLNMTNFYKNWKNYSERHYANTGKQSQAITEKYLENKTWRDLLPNNMPTANIVIEDPYLLDNDKGIFNLIEILKIILPKPTPSQTLHIDIFTDDNNEKFTISLQNKLNDAVKEYLGANYNLIVYLQLPSSVSALHDRRIYTPYYRINSGNSFSYFKKNRNNTISGDRKDKISLDLFLFSNQNNVTTTSVFLEDLKKIREKEPKTIVLHQNEPSKINFLLS
jgi:hypothetical protein